MKAGAVHRVSEDGLVELVRRYKPGIREDCLRDAYRFCRQKHRGDFRKSGEPYFTHPVAVAEILAMQKVDDATVVAALLHDTVEDTNASVKEIARRFGNDVAELVDGVTKLTQLKLRSGKPNQTESDKRQAENVRKFLMAASKDLRVILVKLADRLHNMRTLRSLPEDKRERKAKETMEIYAPLAGRMGMQSMREELEDLAFQVLNPKVRRSILRRLVVLRRESGDVVEKIAHDIRQALERAGIDAEVVGRAKKPYSIWRKMQEKGQDFSRLSDIYAFRTITESEAGCYAALGAIHQRWKAVPGRFKDYISQPKSNGYRSIHTTVSGRGGNLVEVQIRTHEMHDEAERGIAAHWSYRDGLRPGHRSSEDPANWIAPLMVELDAEKDHSAFLEAVKLEMYTDQIFCFTPRGEVIRLPRGATPIDFAYAIHTSIGNACVSAKLDGLRAPLWTPLRTGQSVEIITAEGQTPHKSWRGMVKTGKARSAINRALRDEERKQFIKLGRELIRVAFERIGRKATDKALGVAAKSLSINGIAELLARLGKFEVEARHVVQAVYPKDRAGRGDQVSPQRALIELGPDQPFTLAECCQPVPGERIVGIGFPGRAVEVHAIDCHRLGAYEDELDKWLDLHWRAGNHPAVYGVSLVMTISNCAGVLGRVCSLIGEKQSNISDLVFVDRKPDFYRLVVTVEVPDLKQLLSVVQMLEAESDVAAVERYREKPSLDASAPGIRQYSKRASRKDCRLGLSPP